MNSNKKVALFAAGFALFMLGMAFAAVPLYDIFCRVTGYGGTPKIVASAPGTVASERIIKVRFDANTNRELLWDFRAPERSVSLKVGESGLAFFTAENKDSRPITGMATFNVTPQKAGYYFSKVECFCFSEQHLAAGEKVDMPVSFFIDPEILNDPEMDDITEITLSYSSFESPKAAKIDKRKKPDA